MSKVYVVEKGLYSDCSIFGVFSSEEKAKEAIAHFGDVGDDFEISCVGLDALATLAEQKLNIFYVDIDLYNGNILEIGEDNSSYFLLNNVGKSYDKDRLVMYVAARDKEHAIKIAGEKRREYLVKEDLQQRK